MDFQANSIYAGNLIMELDEITKIIPDGECVEVEGTTTERCVPILTIYCC